MTPDRWADLRARAEAHVAAVIALDEAKKARKRHIELIALDAVRVAAEEFDEAADPATVLALLAERDALRAALRAVLVGCEWKDAHAFMDGTELPAGWSTKRMPDDDTLTAARAALAAGEDAP